MILIWQLALRYLRGKRTGNAVPILSRISMAAIAVGSCAMIVLFSVFNGFEDLIKDLYKAFYPEIKITAARGKFFRVEDVRFQKIHELNGIQQLSCVIEDNVLLTSNDEQQIAILKGVDRNYFSVNNVLPYIYEGRDSIIGGEEPTAMVGLHIANRMGLDVNNAFSRLTIYYPNATAQNMAADPQSALESLQLKPDGVFQVQDEFDSKYVLADINLVQELFHQEKQYSSIEMSLAPGANAEKIKGSLQQILGKNFVVASRYEQNKTLYMVMKTEKWSVYAILVLVLLIASFNMIGALSLLVLEKQKDIAILRAMGASPSSIKRIFVSEGVLWAFIGGGTGLLAGTLLCIGQQKFHWVKLQGAFIIEAYPVALQLTDFILIIVTVLAVGLLAAWYPASKAVHADVPSLKTT